MESFLFLEIYGRLEGHFSTETWAKIQTNKWGEREREWGRVHKNDRSPAADWFCSDGVPNVSELSCPVAGVEDWRRVSIPGTPASLSTVTIGATARWRLIGWWSPQQKDYSQSTPHKRRTAICQKSFEAQGGDPSAATRYVQVRAPCLKGVPGLGGAVTRGGFLGSRGRHSSHCPAGHTGHDSTFSWHQALDVMVCTQVYTGLVTIMTTLTWTVASFIPREVCVRTL